MHTNKLTHEHSELDAIRKCGILGRASELMLRFPNFENPDECAITSIPNSNFVVHISLDI